jgi:hypothetical protein
MEQGAIMHTRVILPCRTLLAHHPCDLLDSTSLTQHLLACCGSMCSYTAGGGGEAPVKPGGAAGTHAGQVSPQEQATCH